MANLLKKKKNLNHLLSPGITCINGNMPMVIYARSVTSASSQRRSHSREPLVGMQRRTHTSFLTKSRIRYFLFARKRRSTSSLLLSSLLMLPMLMRSFHYIYLSYASMYICCILFVPSYLVRYLNFNQYYFITIINIIYYN